jgi:phosphatidylinositol kinase/protein kinase (PI-3  family)
MGDAVTGWCLTGCASCACPGWQGLELAVPGTYIAGEPLVTIAAFAPQLHVISSKQRPRKLTIHGGDGSEYMFLLKVDAAPHH